MRARPFVWISFAVTALKASGAGASLLIDTTLLNPIPPGEQAVIDAAAATWESLILDLDGDPTTDEVLDVRLVRASQPFAGNTGAFAENAAGLPTGALISYDNGSHFSFFVDPTPGSNEEFANISGAPPTYGVLQDSARFGQIDLFNVILHEFGHVLGFLEDYSLWADASDDATATLHYDAQSIGLRGNEDSNALSHLSQADSRYDLMLSSTFFPGPGGPNTGGYGDRRLVSARDLDILESLYGYTVDRSALANIPEPGTITLFAIGVGLLSSRRARC